ncbi:MAG: hypothetical protein JWQ78_897 [Sediminibacterium sp.]|nr:hypothetical protein [Sediminibacterium sp.]
MATTLDIPALLQSMVSAASESLGLNWPAAQDLAVSSFQKIAQNLSEITQMKAAGTVTEEKAILLVSMQVDAAKMVLVTEAGLGLLAAEAAVNAALDIIRTTVNTTIGWRLL